MGIASCQCDLILLVYHFSVHYHDVSRAHALYFDLSSVVTRYCAFASHQSCLCLKLIALTQFPPLYKVASFCGGLVCEGCRAGDDAGGEDVARLLASASVVS